MPRKGSAFAGLSVAIVTPFRGEQLDVKLLREQVDFQIAAGTHCLCPVGTTGESPTLSHEEHERVISEVVQAARGRIKVMAGTGSNSTAEALRLTKWAAKEGADAADGRPVLQQADAGRFFLHYKAVAEQVGIPICVYNIPGRTGKNIEPETIARMAELPNITMVKEATGSLDQASQIRCTTDLTVLSGDDSLTLPLMALGARGDFRRGQYRAARHAGDGQRLFQRRCSRCNEVASQAVSAVPRHARPGDEPHSDQSRHEVTARYGRDEAAAHDAARPRPARRKLRKTLTNYGLL